MRARSAATVDRRVRAPVRAATCPSTNQLWIVNDKASTTSARATISPGAVAAIVREQQNPRYGAPRNPNPRELQASGRSPQHTHARAQERRLHSFSKGVKREGAWPRLDVPGTPRARGGAGGVEEDGADIVVFGGIDWGREPPRLECGRPRVGDLVAATPIVLFWRNSGERARAVDAERHARDAAFPRASEQSASCRRLGQAVLSRLPRSSRFVRRARRRAGSRFIRACQNVLVKAQVPPVDPGAGGPEHQSRHAGSLRGSRPRVLGAARPASNCAAPTTTSLPRRRRPHEWVTEADTDRELTEPRSPPR